MIRSSDLRELESQFRSQRQNRTWPRRPPTSQHDPKRTLSVLAALTEKTARTRRAPSSLLFRLAKRPQPRAQLVHEELRLYPGRKMTALGELVEVDEIEVGALGPTPRSLVDLL